MAKPVLFLSSELHTLTELVMFNIAERNRAQFDWKGRLRTHLQAAGKSAADMERLVEQDSVVIDNQKGIERMAGLLDVLEGANVDEGEL
jgi:hypothetical protein